LPEPLKVFKELIRQGFLKEYVLTLEAVSGSRQSSAPPHPTTARDHPIQSNQV